MARGGPKHRMKVDVDEGLLVKMFVAHQSVLQHLGVYENVSRSMHVDGPGLMFLYSFLWDVILLCPSAEPRESSMRNAFMTMVTMFPKINETKFNNGTWAQLRTERMVTILYHVRRLKREESRLAQIASRLNGPELQKLKDLLRQIELRLPSGCSKDSLSSESQSVLPSPSTSPRILKRKISEVSVDEDGFPNMLRSPPVNMGSSSSGSRAIEHRARTNARMRLNQKSPPLASQQCLAEALGYIPKPKPLATRKATAKSSAKLQDVNSPEAPIPAKPKAKAKAKAHAEPEEVASTAYYPDNASERKDEAPDDAREVDFEEPAPFSDIRVTHAQKGNKRAYLTGVSKETGARTLIVEVSETKTPKYLQMINDIKAHIEQKDLSKQEALALRSSFIESGTYSE